MNLGDDHVGYDVAGLPVFIFDENSLFNAGAEVLRQVRLQGVTGVLDETMMYIAPVQFEPGIHAWKWTRFHFLICLTPQRQRAISSESCREEDFLISLRACF